jgi:putative ABC transport system substrate-binding protein
MIIANSTPTIQALARKETKSPIVFTNVGDPVIAGLGTSYDDHVAGITGVSTMSDFDGMVDMILSLQPGIRRIGTVFAPAEVNSVAYKEGLEKAAKKRGIELVTAAASTATEVTDAAVSLTSKKIGAVCQISDNLTASCISAIIKAAENGRIPMYGFVTKLMGQGVMAVVARDYHQAGYDAGVMVKKVLDGTPAGEIPFQLVTKTIFEVNVTIAAKYKITIPDGLSEKIKLIN